jgi:crotonobetainyl-CoA:carnitine CoA-transferase CaiB-like acyl-CoA transferase
MLQDPDLDSNPKRAQQRAKIMPVVREKFVAETAASLCEKLEKLNIPFGPLATPGDLFDDPHLNSGGRMLDLQLPTGTRTKIPGIPLDMDGRKPAIRMQPPSMGAHTRAVLEESGFSREEIEQLVRDGVVVAK